MPTPAPVGSCLLASPRFASYSCSALASHCQTHLDSGPATPLPSSVPGEKGPTLNMGHICLLLWYPPSPNFRVPSYRTFLWLRYRFPSPAKTCPMLLPCLPYLPCYQLCTELHSCLCCPASQVWLAWLLETNTSHSALLARLPAALASHHALSAHWPSLLGYLLAIPCYDCFSNPARLAEDQNTAFPTSPGTCIRLVTPEGGVLSRAALFPDAANNLLGLTTCVGVALEPLSHPFDNRRQQSLT